MLLKLFSFELFYKKLFQIKYTWYKINKLKFKLKLNNVPLKLYLVWKKFNIIRISVYNLSSKLLNKLGSLPIFILLNNKMSYIILLS